MKEKRHNTTDSELGEFIDESVELETKRMRDTCRTFGQSLILPGMDAREAYDIGWRDGWFTAKTGIEVGGEPMANSDEDSACEHGG